MASERFRCIAAFAVAVYLVGTGAVLNTSSSAADGSYSRRYSIADVAGNMNDRLDAGESTRAAARFALVCGVRSPGLSCCGVLAHPATLAYIPAGDEHWRAGD